MTEPTDLDGTQRKAPRPPLWESTYKESRWTGWVMFAVGVTLFVMVCLPMAERTILSTPPAPVTVEVTGSLLAPANDGPATYDLAVRLPSGRPGVFSSPENYSVGTRLQVMASRGKVSNRLWLQRPYRVISTPSPEPETKYRTLSTEQ